MLSRIKSILFVSLICGLAFTHAQNPTVVTGPESFKKKDLPDENCVLGLYADKVVAFYYNDDSKNYYVSLSNSTSLAQEKEIRLELGEYKRLYSSPAIPLLLGNEVFVFMKTRQENKKVFDLICVKINLSAKTSGAPVTLIESDWSGNFVCSLSEDSTQILCIVDDANDDKGWNYRVTAGVFDKNLKEKNRFTAQNTGNAYAFNGIIEPNGDYTFLYEVLTNPGAKYKDRKYAKHFVRFKNGKEETMALGEDEKIVSEPKFSRNSNGKLFMIGLYAKEALHEIYGFAHADVEKCFKKEEKIIFTEFQTSFLVPNIVRERDNLGYIRLTTLRNAMNVKGSPDEFFLTFESGDYSSPSNPNMNEVDVSANIYCVRYNISEKKDKHTTIIKREVLTKLAPSYRLTGLGDFIVSPVKDGVILFYQNHIDNEQPDVKKTDMVRKVGKNSCVVAAKVSTDGKVEKKILINNAENGLDPYLENVSGFKGNILFARANVDGEIKLIAIKNIF